MIARTTPPTPRSSSPWELRERLGNYVSVKPPQLGNSVSADTSSRMNIVPGHSRDAELAPFTLSRYESRPPACGDWVRRWRLVGEDPARG